MREKKRFLPFVLSLIIIIADQISKLWIVNNIPEGVIGYSFLSDFLWIVHVRNNAVAFSLGENIPNGVKYILFVFLPLLIMAGVAFLIISKKTEKDFNYFQKWCLASIFGGGVGNLIDRVFRSLRVVDFISVKFYGLFGMERFPTWNVADSAVVVGVFLLIVSIIIEERKGLKNERKEKS